MARKSRKIPVEDTPQSVCGPYKAALYIRLSVEDKHTGSISIETQQMILNSFLERTPDIVLYDTYIDNGATGTNFDRPGFQRMLSDIEAGKVNCVIVKDLSRLGRNTIDTGYYIEQYFREYHVRFISVNESFDTSDPESSAGIYLPLRNMINEAYALDIGRKIKAQQRQAMKDGKFVGARAPYGYKKAQNDCHQLVVDPDAAQIVRQMFQWASEGAGLNTIARRLNEAGCQTPSHYKRDSGIITHDKLVGNGDWQTRTVAKILHSPIYTGDLVQGCTKTVDHRQVQANPNDWIVVHGTHEAIVSHEQYEAVQILLAEEARSSREKKIVAYSTNPLKGKVFCGCCGGHLHRRRNSRKTTADVYMYYCLTKSRVNRSACPGVLISEEKLLSMLLDVLLEAMEAILGQYALLLEDDSALDLKKAGLKDELTRCNSDLKRSRDIVGGLYENLVKGIISNSEYLEMRSTYGAKVARLEVEQQRLEKELRTLEMQATNYSRLAKDAAEIKANRQLTVELLNRLVERVDIWPDKHIQVKFLFESEFAQCSEVLKP